jgi:hypothetical protein
MLSMEVWGAALDLGPAAAAALLDLQALMEQAEPVLQVR